MNVISGLVLIAICTLAGWWLTRSLRRAWYPKWAIEIALLALIGLVVAVGFMGAIYERSHPNMGVPEY